MGDSNFKVLSAVLAVVIVIMGIFAFVSNGVDEKVISDEISKQVKEAIKDIKIEVPESQCSESNISAKEIAGLIEIPNVGIPLYWESYMKEHYAEKFVEIESQALVHVIEELEDEEYESLEDFLKANIEGFDEIKDVDVEEEEVKVVLLGLEEDEDKSAKVELELEVEYVLLEGMNVDYKKTVYVTANVVYEEGDFDDEEVKLIFSFK